MAASKTTATLAAMWHYMCSLDATSSPPSVSAVTQFFTPTATVYLGGMGQPPSTSHAELIATTQKLLSYWQMVERKPVTSVVQQDGKVIVNTMENQLSIAGQLVQGLWECEVVTFAKEGLIERYELFVDPSPILAVFARASAANA